MKSRASRVSKSPLSRLPYNNPRPTTFPRTATTHTTSFHNLATRQPRLTISNCLLSCKLSISPNQIRSLSTTTSTSRMGQPTNGVQTSPATPASTMKLNGINGHSTPNGQKYASSVAYATSNSGSTPRKMASAATSSTAPSTMPQDRALLMGISLPPPP